MNAGLTSKQKIYSGAYFILLLIVCGILYKDYGMSWDEATQRNLGLTAYNYLHNGNKEYLRLFDKIYGVGFELPLIYLEKLFHLKDSRNIFLLRHLVYAVFFSFACFLFFRLNLKLFKNTIIALLPALILVCTPRIFGHAFFNSKDIPFLSMYIICFYVLYNYLIRSNLRNLFLLAFCAGMLINFRIMGILFVLLVTGVMLLLAIKKPSKIKWIHPIIFICLAGFILYITWPYLWHRPFENFRIAFVAMSKFALRERVLFDGKIIISGEYTMQYLFTWIGYSVPILYLILSVSGMLVFLVKMIKKPIKFLYNEFSLMGWLCIMSFAIPILAVFYFKSVLYDDWRQLYFIWPFMLIFSGYLVHYLYQWSHQFAKIILVISFGYIGFIGYQMYRLHPFEHVYFNEAMSKENNYLQQNFEGDYWGVSYYSGLKFLLKFDQQQKIPLVNPCYPLLENLLMIPVKERERFVMVDTYVESSYYLTTLRADPQDSVGNKFFTEIVYEIKRQNSVILRIWKK